MIKKRHDYNESSWSMLLQGIICRKTGFPWVGLIASIQRSHLRERIWKKKKSHFLTFRYYLWQLVSVFMAQKILLCLTRWHLSRIAIDAQQYRCLTSILSSFGRLLCIFLTLNRIYMLHSDMCYCTYMINHDIKGARKQQSDDHIQQVWSGGQ